MTIKPGTEKSGTAEPSILPYSLLVGQEDLRLALEISYVNRGIGVLATGKRGTAKSTTVRAFSRMAFGKLPVTLPIGASDDRVLGGWRIESLLKAKDDWQPGLLAQATESEPEILYIDEVNLLDDHLVNLILDAASTRVLVVQRENVDREPERVRFALVGTMNPDEGGLRPQLLDRFGLVVAVDTEDDRDTRRRILSTVLSYEDALDEEERSGRTPDFLRQARADDEAMRAKLAAARTRAPSVTVADETLDACAALAQNFDVIGHRGELVMLRAARALAALEDAGTAGVAHLRRVARPALIHRRQNLESGALRAWGDTEDALVERVLSGAGTP
jgi:magnesium chelatase subunit I